MGKEIYVAKEGFDNLCCLFPIKEGWELTIDRQTSKNRMIIQYEIGDYPGGLHKVKRSTFFRCVEEKSE